METTDYYTELYDAAGDTPLSMKDFVWVFTTPQLTRGYAFAEIYAHETDGLYPYADKHPWNGASGEDLPKYYVGPIPDYPISLCGGLRELADAQIASFAPPSMTTAHGQAKRSRVKTRTAGVQKQPKSRKLSSSQEVSDSDSSY